MSTTLYYRPTPRSHSILPDALRFALKNRDFSNLEYGPITYTVSQIGYLEGLVDGGVEGAQTLIDAIEKHESVDVWLE